MTTAVTAPPFMSSRLIVSTAYCCITRQLQSVALLSGTKEWDDSSICRPSNEIFIIGTGAPCPVTRCATAGEEGDQGKEKREDEGRKEKNEGVERE